MNVRRLSGHAGAVLCVEALGSLVLSSSEDCTARLWDLRTGQRAVKAFAGFSDKVTPTDASLLLSSPTPLSAGEQRLFPRCRRPQRFCRVCKQGLPPFVFRLFLLFF